MGEHDVCDCPLCVAVDKEETIYSDDKVKILETKNLKGHKRRIMVIWTKHNDITLKRIDFDYMADKLEEIGKQAFSYTYKFVIMSSKFATIRDHWHLVASDLEPNSEDFYQMLGTPWIRAIHVRDWQK